MWKKQDFSREHLRRTPVQVLREFSRIDFKNLRSSAKSAANDFELFAP